MSIFRWETLREVGPHALHYARAVPGKVYEVELVGGARILVWRGDDRQTYFCHGLTFGGKEAPGGPISPFSGSPVEMILREHYEPIPEAAARGDDILVWRGLPPESTPHSAVLITPTVSPGGTYLDESSRLRSKNGLLPEAETSLAELIERYGESYNAYRRRER